MTQNENFGPIYLDNQASTPVDPRVLAAMIPFFNQKPGNPHSSDHVFGWEGMAAVNNAAQEISGVLAADPDEIVFTSGATEANNLAILGLARRATKNRFRILVSSIEHKCVLAASLATTRFGFRVELIPVSTQGIIDIEALRAMLDENVLLVSVMAVNNEIGSIQPIEEASSLAHQVGAYIHVDAVHALSLGTFDIGKFDCDLVSLSAHKIYGPKGIGALFIKRELQSKIEPLIYGGDQQGGLRSGTLPVPLCVGFGHAASLMVSSESVEERVRIQSLRNALIIGLKALAFENHLNGPSVENRHPGNANILFLDYDARDILASLQPKIAASMGAACTSGITEPSHVLRAMGMSAKDADSSIRFSVGRFTTMSDIDRAIELLKTALENLS